ncbi:MAG: aminotransferase class I/II-fold pyridoxal phosphate-dependent enzyme [Gorillibacterium sp.]|nr:aminotransferase class I/II-fold pyridoxal phosphate-dependent enzyme [Gorillibacterium sp.]
MLLKPETAPLLDALLRHKTSGAASFHVPGHKSGQGLDAYGDAFFRQIMAIDYTEITGLDDLHHPTGAIREAQELAADCFGADETYFLVGGSTAGNLALILSTCSAGELLIVQRNVHKSVLNGIALSGARAVFLPCRLDEGSGLAAGVTPEDVHAALTRYPEAKAVFLTNPNYYGMTDNLTQVAEIVHAHGKPLLVDEAHGAHFGFHPALPASALSCGADAVVQSTHKMLTAMTMGAMLHVKGQRLDQARIKGVLSTIQSSSPSYPILASLDLCRRQMHVSGQEFIEAGLAVVHELQSKSGEYQSLCILEHTFSSSYGTLDPFKIALNDKTGTLTGYALQERIEMRGCMVELADPQYALCLFSPASTLADANRLHQVLREIDREIQQRGKEMDTFSANKTSTPFLTELSPPISLPLSWLSLLNAATNQAQAMSLKHVEGLYAAEMVVPYPPGIPVLYPGERISARMRDYLQLLAESGARFQGAHDPQLLTLLTTVQPMASLH